MDSWPASNRNNYVLATRRKTTSRRKVKDVFPNYPDIVQGSLNAVTLTERGGGLEWLSVVKDLGDFATACIILSAHSILSGWKISIARGKTHNDLPYNSSPSASHPSVNYTEACRTGSEPIVSLNLSIDINQHHRLISSVLSFRTWIYPQS